MSARLKLGAIALAVCSVSAALTWFFLHNSNDAEVYRPRRAGSVTFNKDVAPIIHQHCVACHRPGQSGPFNLISFEEVKKHVKDIAEVTAKRYMPPWLPEKGYGEFANERRLNATELGLVQQWIREGAPEGSGPKPATPKQSTEPWQLGKPDLVISLPTPYSLPASGRDVYRNFVVPTKVEAPRFVKAFEFRPGSKVVHHGFFYTDRSGQSRQIQQPGGTAGFDGMDTPRGADGPEGFFTSWQPGKVPSGGAEGLAWELAKDSDVLFQLHMKPSGKPELVEPSLGLYFTDRPPTNNPFKIALTSLRIDIPAGARISVVEDSYILPVDLQVLAVLPHAHYLCKEMRGFATLPDGSQKWMLLIRQWDFNWQGDYRYKEPVFLPKGTKLGMQFTYDNSVENIRNPNSPPQRVQYGMQTSDEMGELWFQVLPKDRRDLETLRANYTSRLVRDSVDYNLYRLRINPQDARAHSGLGLAYNMANRLQEAHSELTKAVLLDPNMDEGHYRLGTLLRQLGKPAEAKTEFEATIRLNPQHYRAHGNLGLILMELNELVQAEEHFRTAMRINPNDEIAHDSLGVIMMNDGRLAEAEREFREAARLNPDDQEAQKHLEAVKRIRGRK